MNDGGITREEVEKVARLARLAVTAEEKQVFGRQLNSILEYMEKLGALNVDGIEPLDHVLPLRNVMREDIAASGSGPQAFLAAAPATRDGFFLVPPVLSD
ncbi:MAG TPA: Asp-tRNA(Asn)/Glu-tRNA(Gln) amidotransferase subunit GatC [bacterium]|nr:Asp-tRNA(Asn)/Glu-tRNA(Gln) amidotransferase subunit GatC [bacterium]HPQ66375.1 Asp-tRNA(Asn)/Glu-tRNA(Gln) amidotransferase subunit GatC [bacterium]